METINPDSKINVERLRSLLIQRKTTPLRFKLPLTHTQANDALTAAVQAEVLMRRRTYIDSSDMKQYIAQAAQWLTEATRFGLLLCGLPGNGKSTLMRAIVTLVNYFNLKDPYGDSITATSCDAREVARINRTSYPQYKAVCLRPMLAIDDLGLEPTEVMDYGNILSPVVDLLTMRYNDQLPTIVTTNLTGRDIRDKYGARIADRFNEMMQVIIFKNPSFRQPQQNK